MPHPTPAPDGFAVPVVDISAYTHGGTAEAKALVSRQMDAACSTVGFVQVLGHGIPDDILDGLKEAVDAFFSLPPDVKKSYRVEGANRGYSPPKSESLSLSLGVESASRMNDFFEAFNIGTEARSFTHLDLSEDDYGINVWPDIEGFRSKTDAYYAEAGRVARTLTAVFADALRLPHDFFAALTDHSVDVLRMNNYALPKGTVTLDGELTGMGEHTDFGLVTVLWADQVAGLQVLGLDGVWHDVAPADGALLVNLGDLTARLTKVLAAGGQGSAASSTTRGERSWYGRYAGSGQPCWAGTRDGARPSEPLPRAFGDRLPMGAVEDEADGGPRHPGLTRDVHGCRALRRPRPRHHPSHFVSGAAPGLPTLRRLILTLNA